MRQVKVPNKKRLKVNGTEACEARSQIEFDQPVLRAIVNYGQEEAGIDMLYYQVGGENSTYSFGIDVDRNSCRIVLVELRLYGNKILPWPSSNIDAEVLDDCPLVNTGPWSKGPIIDVDEIFKIQTDGKQLRVELYGAKVACKYRLGSHVMLDVDNVGYVCGVIFQNIDKFIITYLINRYGHYTRNSR